jgi:glutathione peroxidase
MKISTFLIAILFFFIKYGYGQKSFYDITIKSIDNENIKMSSYAGKNVIIIPVSSLDSNISQLEKLTLIKKSIKDSSFFVLVPTTSFGSENKSSDQIKAYYSKYSNSNCIITEVMETKGNGQNKLFKWLTRKTENGKIDSEVKRPLQKYVVNKSGQISGVFSGKLNLNSREFIDGITNIK